MNLEGRPNGTERGEAFPRSGHDMPMRFNFDYPHEKECYHAPPSLSRLQKPKIGRNGFSETLPVEELPAM